MVKKLKPLFSKSLYSVEPLKNLNIIKLVNLIFVIKIIKSKFFDEFLNAYLIFAF